MPDAVWRIMPARSISRWLTIWASDGVSLRVGRKYWDRRMGRRCTKLGPRPPAAADRRQVVFQFVGQGLAIEGQPVAVGRNLTQIGLGLAAGRQGVLVRVLAGADRPQLLGDVDRDDDGKTLRQLQR